MKYRYSLEKGVTKIKTNTRKYVAGILTGVSLAGAVAIPVMAAKPGNPGCFGTDRAANIGTGISGKDWGAVAADRAGDNGTINQDYKTGCGGDPTT